MDEVVTVLDELRAAEARLVATLGKCDEETLSARSSLPGWTRRHVLTHLARNADGLRNLLLAARTGELIRMYATPEARAADIEAGASRPVGIVTADVLQAGHRFLIDAASMPADAWSGEVVFTSGQAEAPKVAAGSIVLMRLNEVEVHHVDLALGYTFDDTPTAVLRRLLLRYIERLHRAGANFRVRVADLDLPPARSTGPEVRGRAASLLAWATGRSPGDNLECDDGVLPALPKLG